MARDAAEVPALRIAQPLLKHFATAGLVFALWPSAAHAQEPAEETEPGVIYELGWAADWSRREGFRPGGATFAFEVTPIEHWLEIEVGATVIRAASATETSVDVLFKKPWTISSSVELMAGAGPELIYAAGDGASGGFDAVVDLMIWPTPHVGWYVEPGYEAVFQSGAVRQGAGIAAGLLIR